MPLLGIYPEKDVILKDTCTPVFTAVLLTTAKAWKPKMERLHTVSKNKTESGLWLRS